MKHNLILLFAIIMLLGCGRATDNRQGAPEYEAELANVVPQSKILLKCPGS